jgi:hypothetical protein
MFASEVCVFFDEAYYRSSSRLNAGWTGAPGVTTVPSCAFPRDVASGAR